MKTTLAASSGAVILAGTGVFWQFLAPPTNHARHKDFGKDFGGEQEDIVFYPRYFLRFQGAEDFQKKKKCHLVQIGAILFLLMASPIN